MRMLTTQRRGRSYSPWSDVGERWSDWTVVSAPTENHEVIVAGPHLILLDCASTDAELALAHHLSHLDLHMGTVLSGDGFSAQQEAEADWLARLRLDRPGTWDS